MRVAVLMSTFQGEPYVAEQLVSILCQLPDDGTVLVRDDGSGDGTVARIEAFGDQRIALMRGANIGFVRSFFCLLQAAPADADIVMLADQDDVWLPGKIERAQRYLSGREAVPRLYCSRLRLVDDDLKPIGLSPAWPRKPSFVNALAENIVTGCSVAMNRAALELVRRCGNPDLVYFHDWWFYLVVAAFGEVFADPEPTALYRQHRGNAIGMGAGISRYWKILRFLSRANFVHIMFNQIENFRAVHGADLNAEQRRHLERYFDPRSSRSVSRLVFWPRRHRQRLLDDLMLRFMVAFAVVSGRGLLP